MMTRWIGAAACAAILLGPSAAVAQTASVCSISSDPEFGRTVEKAVPIGGGVAVIAARQRRYLDALRGPQGQTLQIGTRTTTRTPNAIIDVYPVTWEGGESFQLHLNSYRFGTPQAPQGLTCTQPLSRALGPPPSEPLVAAQEVGALGLDQGRAQWFMPIPLMDAGTTRAVVFDYFRMLAALARAQSAAGRQVGPSVPRPTTVVVANPLTCNGTSVPATEIDVLAGPKDQPLQKAPTLASGQQLSGALSGSTVQPDAVGAMVFVPYLAPNQAIRIKYNVPDACPDLQKEYRLAVVIQEAKPLTTTAPQLPSGNSEADPAVFVQAVIDLDGAFQRPLYMAGPDSLREAALAAVKAWRATPARMNGEPVAQVVTLRVEFSRAQD
jgi:hypothetical protein